MHQDHGKHKHNTYDRDCLLAVARDACGSFFVTVQRAQSSVQVEITNLKTPDFPAGGLHDAALLHNDDVE